jgi:hypothetical protein
MNKEEEYMVAKQLINNIMRRPKKDRGKNKPHVPKINKINDTQQADLLMLPNDKGFKYLLVVVDVQTHKIDCIPLKNKTTQTIANAFNKIYKINNILKVPRQLECDQGTEFKSNKDFFYSLGIKRMKFALVGRHQQMQTVESMNKIIGRIIFLEQHIIQLSTGKLSKAWLHLYKQIINDINKLAKVPKDEKESSPTCEGSSCDILWENDKVLRMLDFPIESDNTQKKLSFNFREGDIKYHPKIRTIKRVLFLPNQPILYVLDGDVQNAYTKNQLYLLNNKEIQFLKKYIDNKHLK